MLNKSIKTISLFAFALIISINIPLQAHASYAEALDIYEKAIKSSALVQKIHEDGLARRQDEARQLNRILASISENHTKDNEKLRESVIQSLEYDKEFFTALNKQLKEQGYQPDVGGTTEQILTNRMPIITEAALKLAKEGNLFFEILDGRLPTGYSIDVPSFNYFSEREHIYANGRRGNALKSLLLKIWQIQNDKTHLQQVSQLFDPSWVETAPFVHITPLPDDFDVSTFQFSPHFFSDSKTPKALLTIHNGYAYGGHRDEPRYPDGKRLGPQDCSSFVAIYAGCKKQFSTSNQAQHFQEINGFQFTHLGQDIIQKWEESKALMQNDEYLKSLRGSLLPLSPSIDPQTLKPGLVHAERIYKGLSTKPEIALSGTSGHTSIFLGTIGSAAETKALTIGANRDLEDTGLEFNFGVEPQPLLKKPKRLIMFFDIKTF